MRATRPIAALASALAATVAFAAPTSEASTDTRPASDARLALAPCRLPGLDREALCGRLARPLDPARTDGPVITLRVAVLPAVARRPHADPVLFLAGGPGQGAVSLAGPLARLTARLGNRRDLVLVDQRGTGDSAPLRCDPPAPTAPLVELADPARQRARLAACRERLQRLPHGDLRRFGTALAVDDLEAVRRALGVARWNVVGVSYGTRVGLELLRRHPQTVRRMVLDAVVDPALRLPRAFARDGQAALDALLAACAADAACAAEHPSLGPRWRAWRATLPTTVTVAHPLTGHPETVRIDADMAAALLRAPLYQPSLAAALPLAMQAAIDGRVDALFGLASAAAGRPGGPGEVAEGMHYSVVCSEDLGDAAAHTAAADASAPSPASAGSPDFGDVFERSYREVCADWPRGAAPPAQRAPLPPTPVAALLLSGGADPVTPPAHAARVAAALGPTARHVVVPNAGHGVLSIGCARDLLFRFVDAADDATALALDAQCLAHVPRPPALRPWPAPTPMPASEPSR